MLFSRFLLASLALYTSTVTALSLPRQTNSIPDALSTLKSTTDEILPSIKETANQMAGNDSARLSLTPMFDDLNKGLVTTSSTIGSSSPGSTTTESASNVSSPEAVAELVATIISDIVETLNNAQVVDTLAPLFPDVDENIAKILTDLDEKMAGILTLVGNSLKDEAGTMFNLGFTRSLGVLNL